jgi:hypothetical protein
MPKPDTNMIPAVSSPLGYPEFPSLDAFALVRPEPNTAPAPAFAMDLAHERFVLAAPSQGLQIEPQS